MISINLNKIAILDINGADYRCIINGISKSGASKLLKNVDLTKKEYQKDFKNYKKFIPIHKMGTEIITFGNIKVEKYKFHQYKSPFSINDVDISKIVLSNSVTFSKKGFNLLGTKMVKKLDLYA